MTADRPATEPRTEAGRAVADLLAEHYKQGTFGRGNADRSKMLADQDVALIEAEAAQGAAPLDGRRSADGITAGSATGFAMTDHTYRHIPCEHCSEGAAPRAEGRTPGDDADCERYGCEDRTHPIHRAAPRAEGLDVPSSPYDADRLYEQPTETLSVELLARAMYGDHVDSDKRNRLHAQKIVIDYARLSRPSNEESDTARSRCKRFRHDEHCDHD